MAARAQTTPAVGSKKETSRGRTDLAGYLFVLPFLLAYGAFLILAVLLLLRMSFYNASLVAADSQFLGLANYRVLFGDPDFWSSLWHTILFTLLSTPPLVLLALIFAMLANRAIAAKWFFRLSFFAPWVLPSSVVARRMRGVDVAGAVGRFLAQPPAEGRLRGGGSRIVAGK